MSSGDRIGHFTPAWNWSRDTLDSVVTTIDVTSPGEHTINVWMSEDGIGELFGLYRPESVARRYCQTA